MTVLVVRALMVGVAAYVFGHIALMPLEQLLDVLR